MYYIMKNYYTFIFNTGYWKKHPLHVMEVYNTEISNSVLKFYAVTILTYSIILNQ